MSIHLSAKDLVDVPEDCEKKFAVLLALCLALNTGQVQRALVIREPLLEILDPVLQRLRLGLGRLEALCGGENATSDAFQTRKTLRAHFLHRVEFVRDVEPSLPLCRQLSLKVAGHGVLQGRMEG